MPRVVVRYPVYNPCVDAVDVAADWGQINTTTCKQTALRQPFSVAAIRVFYDQPWIFNFDPEVAKIDVTEFDLVILSDIEYYPQHQILSWAQSKGIKNFLLALGGLNNEPLENNVMYRPYWTQSYLANNPPGKLNTTNRNYMFDCLLGARRPHRDYVMLALTCTGLIDQCIVTYRDYFSGNIINAQSESFAQLFPKVKLHWPYVSPNLDSNWEIIDHASNQVNLTSPVKIFQQTNYSIITETIGTGEDFFLSEKTTKAMHAYRPFVVFGPRHYLRNLQKLGFQTFGAAIDESYDNEPIDEIRFQKAMLQVLRLAYFESVESVYSKVQFVLENNAAHLARLLLQTQEHMNQLLQQYVDSQHLNYD